MESYIWYFEHIIYQPDQAFLVLDCRNQFYSILVFKVGSSFNRYGNEQNVWKYLIIVTRWYLVFRYYIGKIWRRHWIRWLLGKQFENAWWFRRREWLFFLFKKKNCKWKNLKTLLSDAVETYIVARMKVLEADPKSSNTTGILSYHIISYLILS